GANTYTWTDGTNTYSTSSISVPANSSISYTLIGSAGACNTTTIIGITVSPSVNVNVSVSSNSISIGESTQLIATGANIYTWTPSTGLDNPTSSSPNASPVQTTTYCVLGLDNSGVCSDTACRVIYVDTRCPELFVPNVFSPNNDGVNDKLQVFGTKCVKEFYMVIYDRWGEKVFETDNVNNWWDGKYKDKEMNGATFVYYIKGLYMNNEPIDLKGNFTIVK
ncbi:MAG: gliding motility-associated C-terminal domain-containing protein, partial [Bacteroidota bacterium]